MENGNTSFERHECGGEVEEGVTPKSESKMTKNLIL
jgi:hypothetical protein